jgi:hypothetical protein
MDERRDFFGHDEAADDGGWALGGGFLFRGHGVNWVHSSRFAPGLPRACNVGIRM